MEEQIKRIHQELKRELGGVVGDPLEALDGMLTFNVERSGLVKVLEFLKEYPESAIDMLTDVTAVDWLDKPEKGCRFELVYHLCSTTLNHRIRIKVKIEDDDFSAPSATKVFMGANWLEREIFDMFGVSFSDHPDLRRILTWEGFEGYPLRKDFPTRGYHPPERTPHT